MFPLLNRRWYADTGTLPDDRELAEESVLESEYITSFYDILRDSVHTSGETLYEMLLYRNTPITPK